MLNAAVRQAVQSGIRQVDVARETGLSTAQVSRVARGGTSGATRLPPAEYLVAKLPVQEIAAAYQSGTSAGQLGIDYGCSGSTILSLLKRHNVRRRNGREIELAVGDAVLVRRYVEDRDEIQHIAADLGVKPNLVSRRLAAAGVRIPVGHRRMDLPDEEIVARYHRNEPVKQIARSYGVSWITIMRRIKEDRARNGVG